MNLFYCAYLIVFLICIDGGYGKITYNTYSTAFTRQTGYVPEIISKTCQLKPQGGPCRSVIDMYYFNPREMNCSIFQWGGCQGNGNRFDTLQECRDSCLSRPGYKIRPNYCQLRWDYGFCFGEEPRWYYDQKWQVCKTSIYSGCGGNRNNFYSQEQCDSVCKFGNGPLIMGTLKPAKRFKALIINPMDTTYLRGINQPTTPITQKANVSSP